MKTTIEIFPINDDAWEKVVKSFDKTTEALDQDVILLQEWLKTQPHLPDLLDASCLRNFLILCKFGIEKCKQTIDNYYTIRSKFEDEYGKINPKLAFNEAFCEQAYMEIYPKLDQDMCRISYFKTKPVSLENYEPLYGLKRYLAIQELRLRKDVMFNNILVMDLKELPFACVPKMTPALVYRTAILYEKVYSNRIKAIYLVNMPSFLATLLLIIKRFVKPKLFNRINVLQSEDDLKKYIALDLIPKELGGEGTSLADLQESTNKFLAKECDLFNCLDEIQVDESLRPQKLENDDIMGIYGSFKKIDID